MFKHFNSFAKLCLVLGLLLCFCLSTNCERKESLPSAVTVVQEKTSAPFFFTREFPIQINVTLQFAKELGGGRARVQGSGTMVFNFKPTANPDILTMRLQHIEVALDPIDFPLSSDSSVNIKGIKLESEDFDLKAFEGVLNRSTEEVTLKIPFVLNPQRIPILGKLGIFAPIRLVANEKGRMNIEGRYLETHAEGFNLGEGILGFVTVFGGQYSFFCETEAQLCASTTELPITGMLRGCPQEIWICQGEKAILYWEVSKDVKIAEINPGVGRVSLYEGQVTVDPTTDTEYTLTATGKCEQISSVTVRVVDPGETRLLSATPDRGTGIWSVEVPTQTTSSSILLTSIRTVGCGVGGGIYPLWDCKKTDPDGKVTDFPVTDVETSPALIPLVGHWQFVPRIGIGIVWVPTGNACFEVTIKCTEKNQ